MNRSALAGLGPATLVIFGLATLPLWAEGPVPVRRASPPPALGQFSTALEELAQKVGPAVVEIIATGYAASPVGTFAKERSTGSGVILDPAGYIVTNAHVVQGARRLQVVLPASRDAGGSILKPRGRRVGGQVVGIDSETDLAVLRVEEKDLPALTLGDSEALRQGQIVLAFGSPLGLENSASLGVVSAVARQLEPDSPMIYIQTDAPINPGNSGGPLVDVEGRVVGINTLIYSQGGGSEGLGFAAPSNIVRNVFEQIRATGSVRRGEIGARTQTVTPALAAGLGLPRADGVLVSDVTPGAGASGLQQGDVIVALEGKPMQNARQLDVNIYRRTPGGAVTLDVLRGGQSLKLAVPVTERPREPDALGRLASPETNLVAPLGILGLSLDESLRALLPPTRAKAGVVVAVVTSDGPAWPEAPQRGDVIYALNQQPVTNIEGLRALLNRLKPGDAAALLVERRGQLLYLAAVVD